MNAPERDRIPFASETPHFFWDSAKHGTYRRNPPREGYSGNCDPALTKEREKRKRRQQNRAMRGWLPHAQR